jgi:hypothetical protein
VAAAALIVAFPVRGHLEVLGGAVATAVCLLVAGFGREVSGAAYGLLALVWVVVAVAVAAALERAELRWPLVRARTGAVRHLRAPPEAVFERLAMLPGRSWPGGETGQPDRDGWFDLRLARRYFDPEARAVRLATVTFRARIVAQEATGQVMELRRGERPATLTTLAVTPAHDGSTVRVLWQQERAPILSVILQALCDVRVDALEAEAEVLEGRPTKALWWQPEVSPLVRLAALLPAPTPDDGRPRL